MDQLKSMEVFMRVVEAGSFVAAADKMNISRPMASKHVKSLEDSLGVRLLNRTTRTLAMTEAGRAFYARCQNIFTAIDEAVSEAGNLQIEPRGTLKINAPVSFGRVHLTKAIAGFQNQYSQIAIDLTLNDRLVDIVDEGFDLAIRIGKLSDSSLMARRLAPCRMTLCCSPEYLKKHGTPGHPRELESHNCLKYAYLSELGTWRFTRNDEEHVVEVSGDFTSSYGAATVEAAVAGRGIILEPSFMTATYIEQGLLTRLLPDFVVTELGIFAVYPQSRLLPQKVRVFIDFLADAFGSEPYWDAGLAS